MHLAWIAAHHLLCCLCSEAGWAEQQHLPVLSLNFTRVGQPGGVLHFAWAWGKLSHMLRMLLHTGTQPAVSMLVLGSQGLVQVEACQLR